MLARVNTGVSTDCRKGNALPDYGEGGIEASFSNISDIKWHINAGRAGFPARSYIHALAVFAIHV
jgi:hypothetical protein